MRDSKNVKWESFRVWESDKEKEANVEEIISAATVYVMGGSWVNDTNDWVVCVEPEIRKIKKKTKFEG